MAFTPQSATGASWGAPEIPWGSRERLLLREESWGGGAGSVKLEPWESERSIPHPRVPGFADVRVCPQAVPEGVCQAGGI